MSSIQVGTTVQTADGFEAFVRRVDEKSQRAVLVFTDEDYMAYETMRRLSTLEPVEGVALITDLKAAINSARLRAVELEAVEA